MFILSSPSVCLFVFACVQAHIVHSSPNPLPISTIISSKRRNERATIWKRMSGWARYKRTREVACNKLMMFRRWVWIIQCHFGWTIFDNCCGAVKRASAKMLVSSCMCSCVCTYSSGRFIYAWIYMLLVFQYAVSIVEIRIRPRHTIHTKTFAKTTNIRRHGEIGVCTEKLRNFT